jgi:hypothetical protein
MTPRYQEQIKGPMAWRGSEITKEEIAFDLSTRQVAALEDVLAKVEKAGLPMRAIGLEQARHPALDAPLEKLFEDIQHGRGIAIVRGFPVERHDVEQIGRMYWAFGAHLGRGVSQSARGDLLGLVRDETPPGEAESARGYTSRRELALHTDLGQIVGLMCVRQSRAGGFSQYASGLAIHNELLSRRPDLMPLYYRGFRYHRRGEQPADHPQITPYNVPVFSNVDGHVSVFYVREIAAVAMRDLGVEYTAEELDALDTFRQTARELQFETRLEAGEASFLNNLTTLHARSEFDDWEEADKKRLMLRLWLDAHRDARPSVRELHIYENKDGASGIDPVPGRKPAESIYRLDRHHRQTAAE